MLKGFGWRLVSVEWPGAVSHSDLQCPTVTYNYNQAVAGGKVEAVLGGCSVKVIDNSD